MRRFSAGQKGEIGGIAWRVVAGSKDARREEAEDLRLDLLTSGWVPVKMDVGFLFADFFKENEDVLYPPEFGYRGGKMYLDFCAGAVHLGWEAAAETLRQQRESKRAA